MAHISERAEQFAKRVLRTGGSLSREKELAQEAVENVPVRKRLLQQYKKRRGM